jgi:hypothetical protein
MEIASERTNIGGWTLGMPSPQAYGYCLLVGRIGSGCRHVDVQTVIPHGRFLAHDNEGCDFRVGDLRLCIVHGVSPSWSEFPNHEVFSETT